MRIDLSEQLVHLTRGTLAEAEQSFRSIMNEKMLRGSSNGVRGSHKVVCFSEAPIDVLAKLFSQTSHNFRYRPFGVMVRKDWLFNLGGRPATSISVVDQPYINQTKILTRFLKSCSTDTLDLKGPEGKKTLLLSVSGGSK